MISTRPIRFAWLAVLCCAVLPASRTLQAASFSEFVDPNPAPGNGFGSWVVPLSTGNVVITSPHDDFGGPDAGAVYLFNGSTGALISTLRGSTANDQVGNSGVTALTNGNYVVRSPFWDNGATADAGAVTWGSGTIGVSGTASAANSLVGSTANDVVGYNGVTALTNGNYVVRSQIWSNGAIASAGAVTWGSGTTGVSGTVSASNSLVGSTANDWVGQDGVTALANGNYVVRSPNWDNGSTVNAGAVTWGSGTTGVSGTASAANSLVGSTAGDQVGGLGLGVTVLTNGNYVVRSPDWDNGAIANAGAVTWCSGTTGVSGTVSAANSLVGSTANDAIGNNGVTALTNGNYVVSSSSWDNGPAFQAGAVTWGSGTTGVFGTVSAANSLVGSRASDLVGTVTALTNGNYVVLSPLWDNGATASVGAVTWGSGTTGVAGAVSAANSLIGSKTFDFANGSRVAALTNGNYVVWIPNWDDGATANVGAVTWRSGTSGVSGTISAANSLVGSSASDQVGYSGVTALTNGNYVVRSPLWNANAGAATWGSGTTGISGTISAANSLVGSTLGDNVGGSGVAALTNGNYVVQSGGWSNGATYQAGAATWGSGTTGISGTISTANSLVGASDNDLVGNSGVTVLSNGNYLVLSENWDNGANVDAGAVTWGSGTTGTSGTVSAANSLVGSTADDKVGGYGLTVLTSGDYVVTSSYWDNGATVDAGAATWGSGEAGVTGVVSSINSIVGAAASTGLNPAIDDPVNGTFICTFGAEGGGRVRVRSAGTVSVPDRPVANLSFSLGGPQPNPARSEFRYAVTLPKAMRVRVDLYDVAGRRVSQLVDQRLPAGHHGLEWSRGTAALRPGLYFLRLQAAGASAVRAVVLLE